MRRLTAVLAALSLMGGIAIPGWADSTAGSARVPVVSVVIASGNRAEFTHRLPTGREVGPVGRIAGTPNFPTALALSGDELLVLSGGATHARTLSVYSAATLSAENRLLVTTEQSDGPPGSLHEQDLFQGLVSGADGRLYAAGGSSNDVLALRLKGKKLVLMRRYGLAWQPFPANQYPYQYQGHWNSKPRLFYPDSVAIGPRGRHLFVTGMLSNSLARVNLADGAVLYANAGPYPYAVALADRGRLAVVSDWGGRGLRIFDAATLRPLGTVNLMDDLGFHEAVSGLHPTALAVAKNSAHVFVALSNMNEVVEVNAATRHVVRIFNVGPYPDAPPGSYPDAVTVGDGRLYVANAGNDDVTVFDLASGARLGLIPTGWYPTALAVTHDILYVASAKGLGSGPNLSHQWVGNMMHGLVQRVPLSDLSVRSPRWTARALQLGGFDAETRAAIARENHTATSFLRRHIRYVVFILRENKTFDEDLGRYRKAGAAADPHLALYDRKELPNLYRIAGQGALFTDFMVDGEVTAQGHQWTTGASDSDFVQRTWQEYYTQRGLVQNPGWTSSLPPRGAPGWGGVPGGAVNPYEIYEDLDKLGSWSNPWIVYPKGLYLFNDLLAHDVSFEDFGEFVSRTRHGAISAELQPHLATGFPGWDRFILDTYRTAVVTHWLKAHARRFPHFLYVWLPDDHTAGTTPCYYTAAYYVWNNDLATGKLLAYLSHTPEWRHMAVFITEDDAQSGADHVNAHRSFAVLASPWVQRGALVSNHYSQVDIVRTMETLLGVPPMSQWDANARVITGVWRDHPNYAPYMAINTHFPVSYNGGTCSVRDMKRRAAGTSMTPTGLLRVSGPLQMREEWLDVKGPDRFAEVMAYLHRYAKAHHAPLAAFLGQN